MTQTRSDEEEVCLRSKCGAVILLDNYKSVTDIAFNCLLNPVRKTTDVTEY